MASPLVVSSFTFDAKYVASLREGDPATEGHFVSYFSATLRKTLRRKLRYTDWAEDVLQETFLRVLTAIRVGQGVRQPEHFDIFVSGVCNNVLRETYRRHKALAPLPPDCDPPSPQRSPYACALAKEAGHHVRQVLARLQPDSRAILNVVFLEEHDRDEICRRFGIKRNYLRLLIHRAKKEFGIKEKKLKSKMQACAPPLPGRRGLPASKKGPVLIGGMRREGLYPRPMPQPAMIAKDLSALSC